MPRQAGDFTKEVEITPEMIAAGCEVAGVFDSGSDPEVVTAAVYLAMEEVRLGRTPSWLCKVS